MYGSGKEGSVDSLNYDVYDILQVEGSAVALVVQQRYFYRKKASYYPEISKAYYLIRVLDAGRTDVRELDNPAVVNRRAKAARTLGDLIRHYTGEKRLKAGVQRSGWESETAYKVVARRADGTLESVFDASEWVIGKWRSEAAQEDHGGGFYAYADADTAVRNTVANKTFARAWTEGKELVLVECDVAGRSIHYDSGKVAWSRMRVTRVVSSVPNLADVGEPE